ncbi:MAG TPA: DUF998 domain-containing protein [Polyangiaceae bacterium]|nr:DUF998 domain-containing protein [Polyangiaceae bacterium]
MPVSNLERAHAFNYQLQRLMIGVAAGLLPILVFFFGCDQLTSISASYHSDARDIFVACLSAVGGLMLPYQGKDATEKEEFWLAKVGGLAALVVAFVPTACPPTGEPSYTCLVDVACSTANESVHIGAAIVVFGILVRLCWIFHNRALAKKNEEGPMAAIRAYVYRGCIAANLLGFIIIALTKTDVNLGATAMFRGEAILLGAFSIAWLTASQLILVDPKVRPTLMPKGQSTVEVKPDPS